MQNAPTPTPPIPPPVSLQVAPTADRRGIALQAEAAGGVGARIVIPIAQLAGFRAALDEAEGHCNGGGRIIVPELVPARS